MKIIVRTDVVPEGDAGVLPGGVMRTINKAAHEMGRGENDIKLHVIDGSPEEDIPKLEQAGYIVTLEM